MTCSTKPGMGILPNDYSIKEVVVGTGFEPVKAKPADLQSAPFDRFGILPPEKSRGLRQIVARLSHFFASDCAILCHADHHTRGTTTPDGGGAETNTPPPLNHLEDGLFGCDW